MFKKIIVGIFMISLSLAAKNGGGGSGDTYNIPVNAAIPINTAANLNLQTWGNNANLKKNKIQTAGNAGNNNLDVQTNYASGYVSNVGNSMSQGNTLNA